MCLSLLIRILASSVAAPTRLSSPRTQWLIGIVIFASSLVAIVFIGYAIKMDPNKLNQTNYVPYRKPVFSMNSANRFANRNRTNSVDEAKEADTSIDELSRLYLKKFFDSVVSI